MTSIAFIRPTAIERLRGRLLRAPDHDASMGGGEAGGAGAAAAGSADSGAAAGAADPGAAAAGDAGETSLLGGAISGDAGAAGASQDDAGGEGGGDAGEKTPEHVVPDTYELALDGTDLDAAAVEEAAPVFKEAGLSNEQANKLMPAAVKFRDRVADATMQQLVDAGAKQKADWAEATKSDPDIGGARLEETLHLSAKALDALGYPEGSDFRKVLTETGFGNHPEMVRMMRKIGGMVSEDTFPRDGATPASALSIEKRLYPKD